MGLRFRARKPVQIGPVVLRFNQSGFTGWGIKIGRYRWNARTGEHSLDTPGWGGLRWGGKRRTGPATRKRAG